MAILGSFEQIEVTALIFRSPKPILRMTSHLHSCCWVHNIGSSRQHICFLLRCGGRLFFRCSKRWLHRGTSLHNFRCRRHRKSQLLAIHVVVIVEHVHRFFQVTKLAWIHQHDLLVGHLTLDDLFEKVVGCRVPTRTFQHFAFQRF